MITFKFVDEVTGRKQDINAHSLPVQDNTCHVFHPPLYTYNELLDRIEFFGRHSYYYSYFEDKWTVFDSEEDDDDTNFLECNEIVIK